MALPWKLGNEIPEPPQIKVRNPLRQGVLGKRAIGGIRWGDILAGIAALSEPQAAAEFYGGFQQGVEGKRKQANDQYNEMLPIWQRQQQEAADQRRWESESEATRLWRQAQLKQDADRLEYEKTSDAAKLKADAESNAAKAKADSIKALQDSRDKVLTESGPIAAQPYEVKYRRAAGIPMPPTPLGQSDANAMGLGFISGGFQGLNKALAGSLQENEPLLLAPEAGSRQDYNRARAEKARADADYTQGPRTSLSEAQARLINDGRLPEALARTGYTQAQTRLILEGKMRLNEAQIASLENMMGYRTGMLGVARGNLGVRQFLAPYQGMGSISGMLPEGATVYAPSPFGYQPTLPPYATDPNAQPPTGGLPYMPMPPETVPPSKPAPKTQTIPLTRKGALPKGKETQKPVSPQEMKQLDVFGFTQPRKRTKPKPKAKPKTGNSRVDSL